MTAVHNETALKILDCAEHLARTRGFSGFSYKDISAEVGVKTASIHYYFQTKSDLACALLDRCRKIFGTELERIDRETDSSVEKLERYAGLFERRLKRGRKEICVFGMFSAESEQLSEAAKARVRGFFSDNARWLARVLEAGRAAGALRFTGAPDVVANQVLATIEGAMLLVRTNDYRPAKFRALSDSLIAMLRGQVS